ncbi:hypothetical protein HYH03_016021 [Edaphochlamys debaryana]|uniref:NADPH-dependent diflavin oxidoreductase 1 n=1 Tax=Edaphochlamys debaryana TaxID=47281 RepID=A0A835XKT3_9CHLO|nr:hypothetical protein HYH03_016021 [Edaphochlamys debaryana]|eukprot:KAG2485235.1 hypothetical protein HYH03_016021 [Edaphochlamys debaryana]
MDAPLLVLYGSQTGCAQDVAERVGREARLRLFAPRVLAMDSYDVTSLPAERLVVLVASTTGQGDPPDNMRRFWRFLLRKSLPPDSLGALRCAVFGLGDSGYPNYNVAAKKLDRRLVGLGATALLPLGLGDDQHANGYEAALDPWLTRLWAALREACPLPPGVQQPVLTEDALLALSPPKYRLTYLTPAEAELAAAALAARLQREQPHLPGLAEAALAAPGAPSGSSAGSAAGGGGLAEALRLSEAAIAAADFRRVAQTAAGADVDPDPSAPPAAAVGTSGRDPAGHAENGAVRHQYGPWRPYLARLVANERLTAPDHFQDTRHLDLDLGESGLLYEPGDSIAVLPMTPASVVDAFLGRMGLDGAAWVRVEAAEQRPAGVGAQEGGGEGQRPPRLEARLRSLVQGCLDVGGASPRRYLFQVLHAFAATELERDRLATFACAEGRDELYRYNQREGRTLLEVLTDFGSAAPPLERLLEAAPLLRPRLFSAASSQRLRGRGVAQLLVALVSYKTPYKRTKVGLCSAYLASLDPKAAEAAGQQVRVAVWVEKGTLRLPRDPRVPLILVGPGTGVAPFRSVLEDRYALLRAWEQAQQAQHGAHEVQHGAGPLVRPAPCHLFFGCRGPHADYYYREQWEAYEAAGVLAPPGQAGLVNAFSRERPQPDRSQQGPAGDTAAGADGATEAAPAPAAEGASTAGRAGGGGGGGGGGKVYVSHRIREHGAVLWGLLAGEPGASVMVAGSAQRMPAGVAEAFRDVAAAQGGLAAEAAAAWVRGLEAKGRYQAQTLHAAARQLAAVCALLAPAGGAQGAGPPAHGGALRRRACDLTSLHMRLVGNLVAFAKAQHDSALVESLVAALEESSLLGHGSRSVLLLLDPPPAAPPPLQLLGLQANLVMWLCAAANQTCGLARAEVGRPPPIDAARIEAALGPCCRRALLLLGPWALAAADGQPCGLLRDFLISPPITVGAGYPCLHSVMPCTCLVEFGLDAASPAPSMSPRAILRLALRALVLAAASARASAGAVSRGPSGGLVVDLSWAGGRRRCTQTFKLLVQPGDVGPVGRQALVTLVDAAQRWPRAWDAEAATAWGPLLTSLIVSLPEAADAQTRGWVDTVTQLLCSAVRGTQGEEGAPPPLVLDPAQLPPYATAALEGGVVPLLETMLRCAAGSPAGPEAQLVTRFLLTAPPGSFPTLLAHSPPRQAASLLLTMAKLLRKVVSFDALLLPSRLSMEMRLQEVVALAANELLDYALRAARLEAEAEAEEPASEAAVEPAAPCAPVRVLALAVLQLLPEFASLTREIVKLWRTLRSDLRTQCAHGTLLDASVRIMVRAIFLVGCDGAQAAPPHRTASALCLPFLVEECGAAPLLGALLDAALLEGEQGSWMGSTHADVFACSCLAVYARYPQLVVGARESGPDGGSNLLRVAWSPEALRLLATRVSDALPEARQELEDLADRLDQPAGGQAAPALEPPPAAAPAADVVRLAALRAEAAALLPACANPACASMEGDSEADVRLQQCGRCRRVSYCCRECQTAHWKGGHQAVCGAGSG